MQWLLTNRLSERGLDKVFLLCLSLISNPLVLYVFIIAKKVDFIHYAYNVLDCIVFNYDDIDKSCALNTGGKLQCKSPTIYIHKTWHSNFQVSIFPFCLTNLSVAVLFSRHLIRPCDITFCSFLMGTWIIGFSVFSLD